MKILVGIILLLLVVGILACCKVSGDISREEEKRDGKRWEWFDDEECGIFRCSCCSCGVGYPMKYCPNCGAKMDGDENV